MAKDKKEAAPEPAAEAAPAKKKLPMKMIMAGLAVVVLEGATIGVTAMMTGGPKRAQADVPASAPAPVVEKDVELVIVDAKLPNNQDGKLYLFDLQVVAKVEEKNEKKVEELLKERAAEIKDRIRTIIASSDRKSLSEPGLETLRRQVMYQLEQDLGKDLIKELLIPKCTPYRAEF